MSFLPSTFSCSSPHLFRLLVNLLLLLSPHPSPPPHLSSSSFSTAPSPSYFLLPITCLLPSSFPQLILPFPPSPPLPSPHLQLLSPVYPFHTLYPSIPLSSFSSPFHLFSSSSYFLPCHSILPPSLLPLLLLFGGEMTANPHLNYNLTFHPDFTQTGFSFTLRRPVVNLSLSLCSFVFLSVSHPFSTSLQLSQFV